MHVHNALQIRVLIDNVRLLALLPIQRKVVPFFYLIVPKLRARKIHFITLMGICFYLSSAWLSLSVPRHFEKSLALCSVPSLVSRKPSAGRKGKVSPTSSDIFSRHALQQKEAKGSSSGSDRGSQVTTSFEVGSCPVIFAELTN